MCFGYGFILWRFAYFDVWFRVSRERNRAVLGFTSHTQVYFKSSIISQRQTQSIYQRSLPESQPNSIPEYEDMRHYTSLASHLLHGSSIRCSPQNIHIPGAKIVEGGCAR